MVKKIIVASHRRSGTHLTIDAIVNNFQIFRNAPPIPAVTLDLLSTTSGSNLSVEEHDSRLKGRSAVLKTHAHGRPRAYYLGDDALAKYINQLYDEAKKIYVHRDGRDVMISLYHYQKRLAQISEELPFSEYIRGLNSFDTHSYAGKMRRLEYWVYHVSSWLDKQDVLIVSYDELQENYLNILQEISAFIGVPLEAEILDVRRSAEKNDYLSKTMRHLTSRLKGIKYSTVSFRSGTSGDWEKYFSLTDLEYFSGLAGELNHRLGYQQ